MAEIVDSPTGGTGLLAIFCDLDESDKTDFRPWLTEDMFPARMAIGFDACASFDLIAGTGQEFLTLYEMPSLGHLYGEPYQALRRQRKPRDAAYHKKFRNPDRYTLAWTGPELSGVHDGDSGLASLIRVDRFELSDDAIESFNISYVRDHLTASAELDEVIRVRRYLAMEGQPSHVVITDYRTMPEKPLETVLETASGQTGWYQRIVSA
ncbi:MAG: hypothetical protein V7788_07995 [Alphaproteobacteria bacterium]